MNIITNQRKIALSTLAVLGATTFGGLAVKPANASSDTWKKIAIGAGVVTGYGLLKGKKDVALIGGIATVGSYLKYRSDKKKEDREAQNRYRYNYRRR
jgi:hypothetical protein